jgi:hypothetical protein
MQKLTLFFLMAFSLTACGWGRWPDDAISLDSTDSTENNIPGLSRLADGNLLTPFMLDGRLLYENGKHWWFDNGKAQSGQHYRTRFVYDGRGRVVASLPLDSVAHFFSFYNPLLRHHNPEMPVGLEFYGEVTPGGRLIYHFDWMGELMFWDTGRQDSVEVAKLISIPYERVQAEGKLHSFGFLSSRERDRFESMGYFPPEQQYAPKQGIGKLYRPEDEVEIPGTDYEGSSDAELMRKGREMLKYGMAVEAKRDEYVSRLLVPHLDSLQREYEREFGCMIADRARDAFILSSDAMPKLYEPYSELNGTRKFAVMPGTGFAIEPTPGMTVPELPVVEAAPLPEWNGDEVVLHRIGTKHRLQFTPVAFIPRWTMRTTHYYKLTVAGRSWKVSSGERLRVLDARRDDGKVCFSLINEAGAARLYSRDPETGTEY